MSSGKTCGLAAAATVAFCASFADAGTVTYTCDTSSTGNPDTYAAGTCSYLNSTIAGIYNSTFSNANASIFIQQGNTGLGASATAESFVSYGDYLSALTGTASGSALDRSALAALNSLDAGVYGSDSVVITSALAGALGFTGVGGITPDFGDCTLGIDPNCYNGVIIVTTPANLASETGQSLYWRQLGGSQGNAYDYYSVVEHETDEILGTISCIDTTNSKLTDPCDAGTRAPAGTGTPSANDLFRFNSAGSLAVNNAYLGLSQAPDGAYFSYDGGLTNGTGTVFNTHSNGLDYADYASNCTRIQDARGCPGQSLDITTDGRGEINMLDAVGYNLAIPEPGTLLLLGVGLAGIRLRRICCSDRPARRGLNKVSRYRR